MMTSVLAIVDADREAELLAGYRELEEGPKPEGLVRSELLHSRDGHWLIQTVWRDREALGALRAAGAPPAAARLFEQVGAKPELHDFLSIEARLGE